MQAQPLNTFSKISITMQKVSVSISSMKWKMETVFGLPMNTTKRHFVSVHMQTRRKRSGRTEKELLQDLYYTYDPVGNITYIRDGAQQDLFIRGRVVEPSTDYTYDAIYRLIEVTGREHLGIGSANPPEPTNHTDDPRIGLNLNDPNFLGYIQGEVYV